MMYDSERIAARMNDQERLMLQQITEPTYVASLSGHARRSLCIMPDGELRHYYGSDFLASDNGGLAWKKYLLHGDEMGASVRNPHSGRYVTVLSNETDGTFARLSDIGPQDTAYRTVKITDTAYIDLLQPQYLTARNRWIVPLSHMSECGYNPAFAYSDDDGEHWTVKELQSAPDHRAVYPDKGLRWQNSGSEPACALMPDGSLLLLARTSQNVLWQYCSNDGGETWSRGEPSPFHATLTSPNMLRLSDGRVLLFWNNTQPMPELNHKNTVNVFEHQQRGEAEDVFTNRDVCHAAITEDGVHWIGMREIKLSPIRNAADYRYTGGENGDKSYQQFQAVELPDSRVLLEFGQNHVCCCAVIFAVDWLYQKGRVEDLADGMQYLTTHLYRQSVSGSTSFSYFVGENRMNGHCTWNRADGAVPVPDPLTLDREVLQINRYHDERLFNELQGVVWNFPTMRRGEIVCSMLVRGAGVRVSLSDRWFNACDPTAYLSSPVTLSVERSDLHDEGYHDIALRFDADAGILRVYDRSMKDPDGNCMPNGYLFSARFKDTCPLGISYLHLQTMAEQADPEGTYLARMEAIPADDDPDFAV